MPLTVDSDGAERMGCIWGKRLERSSDMVANTPCREETCGKLLSVKRKILHLARALAQYTMENALGGSGPIASPPTAAWSAASPTRASDPSQPRFRNRANQLQLFLTCGGCGG